MQNYDKSHFGGYNFININAMAVRIIHNFKDIFMLLEDLVNLVMQQLIYHNSEVIIPCPTYHSSALTYQYPTYHSSALTIFKIMSMQNKFLWHNFF